MKRCFSLRLFMSIPVLILLYACGHQTSPVPKVPCNEEAAAIAMDFLKVQAFAGQYLSEPYRCQNVNDSTYIVSFKRKDDAKPNEGWVRVNLKTKEAEWQPLK